LGVYTITSGEYSSSGKGDAVSDRNGQYTAVPGSSSTTELASDSDRRRGDEDPREPPGESLKKGRYERTSGPSVKSSSGISTDTEAIKAARAIDLRKESTV
jgi:hypothetical protein